MNNTGLTIDAAAQIAPAIFGEVPSPRVSERYSFIPTRPIVEALIDDGWVITRAQSGATGRGTKRQVTPFSEHLVRMTRAESLNKDAEHRFEITLINSHDRTRRFQLSAGIFRLICSNGLVIMDEQCAPSVKITHYNLRQTTQDIVQGARDLGGHVEQVESRIAEMKARELSRDEVLDFGRRAIELRYRGSLSPLDPVTLMDNVRRDADRGDNLWQVLNRAQEHLIVGGLFTGHRHTRPMVSLTEQLLVNRGLWAMATQVLDGNLANN